MNHNFVYIHRPLTLGQFNHFCLNVGFAFFYSSVCLYRNTFAEVFPIPSLGLGSPTGKNLVLIYLGG